MVLKVFLFHDLPSRLDDAFECKFSTIKFKSKVGNDEVLLAALVSSNHHLNHKHLQLHLRTYGKEKLGSGWSLEEGSDNYGSLEKKGETGLISFFSHLNEKKANALVNAFSKVLPDLPKDTKIRVPDGIRQNEIGFIETLQKILEKRRLLRSSTTLFPTIFPSAF